MHSREKLNSARSVSTSSAVEKTVLPNGLTVATETVTSVRSVSIGLWTETGSRDETKENNGISHFIEHLVFKGTKKRDYIEISKSMERVGGYLNAFTSKEQTCFYARTLDEYASVAVDVLSDMVFHSIFPKAEMEKEKDVIIEEIRSADDTPDDVIFEDFDKYIYGAHPFAMPIAGSEKTVRSFSRERTMAHIASHYTPSNMLLTAAGNISHAALVKLAEKFIPKSKTKSARRRVLYQPETYKPFEKTVAKPISQAHVVMGFPFDRSDANYYTLLLLNAALGGGMSSRLNLELREKHGLAYSVYSSFSSGDETNLMSIYIGTDKQKVSKSIRLIREELRKMAEKKISERELELNKAQLKGGLIMSQESMSARMNHIARDIYYFKRNRTDDEVIDAVNAVTPAQIRDYAAMLFDESQYSTIIYEPKRK
jgi:predicted Zn-dependent peptidase